jgi:O-antigen/teichoic acid export membrane protein
LRQLQGWLRTRQNKEAELETLKRAVRNILSQLGAQAVTWGATLFFTAALGRYLGDSGFGVLYLALSFTGLFSVLVDFGLQPLASREIARAHGLVSQYLLHGVVLKLVLWMVAFVAIQASIAGLDYSDQTRQVITIYSVTMGLTSLHSLLAALFRGLERLGHPSIGTVIEKVITAAVGIVLLARGSGVVEMAWVILLGAAAHVSWLSVALLIRLPIRLAPNPLLLRHLLIGGLPFAAYSVMSTIYWRIDAVMLSKMTDDAIVGWYGAAYRLSDTLGFLPHIVAASVMMPIISRVSRRSATETKIAFEKGLNVLLLAGIPLCVGLVMLAGPILELIYQKPEFLNATPVLQILAFALLLEYVNSATGWALISLDRERQLLLVPTAAAVVNIALNLLMIPLWQHVGAALATLISEALIGASFLALLPKWLLSRKSLDVALKTAGASAGMAAVLLMAGDLPVLPLVILGTTVYLVLVLTLRVIPHEDFLMLREAIGRTPSHSNAKTLDPA